MDPAVNESPNGEKCQRCGEIGEDRRTLWMACFYDLGELGLPFEKRHLFHARLEDLAPANAPIIVEVPPGMPIPNRQITIAPGTVRCSGELIPQGLYTLRVCKRCRGDWMNAIAQWFRTPPERRESCGSGIFVRRGGVNVEITEEEWREMHPDGREPIRVRDDNNGDGSDE